MGEVVANVAKDMDTYSLTLPLGLSLNYFIVIKKNTGIFFFALLFDIIKTTLKTLHQYLKNSIIYQNANQ